MTDGGSGPRDLNENQLYDDKADVRRFRPHAPGR